MSSNFTRYRDTLLGRGAARATAGVGRQLRDQPRDRRYHDGTDRDLGADYGDPATALVVAANTTPIVGIVLSSMLNSAGTDIPVAAAFVVSNALPVLAYTLLYVTAASACRCHSCFYRPQPPTGSGYTCRSMQIRSHA